MKSTQIAARAEIAAGELSAASQVRGRMMISNAILYTRSGCHLCDDAAAALRRQGVAFEIVNIDEDDALRARYDECVPVVVIDGKERFRGRVDEVLLRRLIASGERSAGG
jgi:glutaredoxin